MIGFSIPRLGITIAPVLLAAAGIAACSASSGHGPGAVTGSGGGSTQTTSGTGGQTGADAGDDCTVLCATEIGACPKTQAPGCIAACEVSKAAVTWCTTEATAATDCLAKQPASSFQCDMNGAPSPSTGVCASEIAAAQTCWYKGPAGGLPDLTQACADFCKYESFLSCADPNCQKDCAATLQAQAPDAGPICNGAVAAVISCASKKPPSDFQCSMAMPPLPELKPGICPFEVGLLAACLAQK